MGRLSNFAIEFKLKPNSDEIKTILNNFSDIIEEKIFIKNIMLLNHPFWKDDRNGYINIRESAFGYICHGELKDYDSTIGKFLHWVMPFIDAEVGTKIGYYQFEHGKKTPIIVGDKEIYGEKYWNS